MVILWSESKGLLCKYRSRENRFAFTPKCVVNFEEQLNHKIRCQQVHCLGQISVYVNWQSTISNNLSFRKNNKKMHHHNINNFTVSLHTNKIIIAIEKHILNTNSKLQTNIRFSTWTGLIYKKIYAKGNYLFISSIILCL